MRVDATGTKTLTLASCWGEPNHITWVLVWFSRSLLAFSQASMSTRHAVWRARRLPQRPWPKWLRIVGILVQVEATVGVPLFRPKFWRLSMSMMLSSPHIENTNVISPGNGIVFDVLQPTQSSYLNVTIYFVNFVVFTVPMTLNLASRSSEVVDFGTNRKRI